MKKTIYLIIFLLSLVTQISAQSVMSNAAFSSQRRQQSSMSSSPMGIGVSAPSYNIAPLNSGSSYTPSVRMNSYSPSGSRYSSNIYSPFTANNPQQVMRKVITPDNDGDDDDEDPTEDPGNPGPPMSIGDGIWVMIILAFMYFTILKRHQKSC